MNEARPRCKSDQAATRQYKRTGAPNQLALVNLVLIHYDVFMTYKTQVADVHGPNEPKP